MIFAANELFQLCVTIMVINVEIVTANVTVICTSIDYGLMRGEWKICSVRNIDDVVKYS